MITVALLLIPGARLFDVALVNETWAPTRLSSGELDVDLRRCSVVRNVPLSDGASCASDENLAWAKTADLVLVPGLEDLNSELDIRYLDVIRAVHARGGIVASLCSGAFVLAKSGILDGRRATTHWALSERLASAFPQVEVDSGALFVGEGNVWSSAGVAAGIDLCVELIRRLFNARTANMVARSMVMAPHREGGQAQFIESPIPVSELEGKVFEAVRALLHSQPAAQWSVASLAGELRMSERTFLRKFKDETGTTPARWIASWRISEACRLLEESEASIGQIASKTGFASEVAFRQRFIALKGTAPSEYRRSFQLKLERATNL
ncbi:GlxA family transcriptional regulator [Glutamicibacter uratoxydans]|uniref:GlxA family transcriptional regulator n=1 Tax=Glutamicibacter uratoxydans TaxID=43667 RepID=UPI00114265D3|nr:helix-turn-helix domain-containing protein [Glutamicibacter uratoxydans]